MPAARVKYSSTILIAFSFITKKIRNSFFFHVFSLLWETLTGREHLLFYGRLKNIKGPALKQVCFTTLLLLSYMLRTPPRKCYYSWIYDYIFKAVEESLKSVSLFDGGVADKPAGKYSGGMKRRLSVAISLIGNPKVLSMVYCHMILLGIYQ